METGHPHGCGCNQCSAQQNEFASRIPIVIKDVATISVQGPSGKNNILVGGQTDSSGVLDANSTDDALTDGVQSTLAGAGFDITAKPSASAVVDGTDTTNTKYWVGLSRAFLNLMGGKVVPALVKTGGTTGQVLSKNSGTDYDTVWADPLGEKYNTTSTSSQGAISTIVDTLQSAGYVNTSFVVASGLAYKIGQQIWMIDYSSSTLTPANYLTGIVTSYSGTSLGVSVLYAFGSGNPSLWYISLGSATQIPYFDATTNNGYYLQNVNGVIAWVSSLLPVGTTVVFPTSSNIPVGWEWCNGDPITKSGGTTNYPALYNLLTNNGTDTSSPYYISPTSCLKPNYNDAVVGGLGTLITVAGSSQGTNKLATGILPANLPIVSPYSLVDPGHHHLIGQYENFGSDGGSPDKSVLYDTTPAQATANAMTGITQANNNDISGGGQALDMRQKTVGAIYIIKAV